MPQDDEALREIFGNVEEDGNRLIQLAYPEVPKKSGKTEFAADLRQATPGQHPLQLTIND